MSKEAMKLALEALNLIDLEFVCNGAHHAKKDRHKLGDDCPVTARYQLAIKALEEALKQEQGEPVAWYDREIDCAYTNAELDGGETNGLEPLYTTPQPAQKPLTDEQIRKASLEAGMQEHYMDFHSGFIRFAKAIEAAHGIKE